MERIGEKLRKRREELGFTIDDIARATNFRPELIKAVEGGRTTAFSADAYLKAFLRAYATKLDLDPRDIILEQKSEEERIHEALSGMRIKRRRASSLPGWLVPALVAAAVAVGLFLIGKFVIYDRVLKDSVVSPAGVPASEDLSGSGSVGKEADGESVDDASATGPQAAARDSAPPAEEDATGATEEEGMVVAAPKQEPDSLSISVSGWSTHVKLRSGEAVLLDEMLSPGFRKTFYSRQPFLFDHITNKDAVSLLFNGRPVRLPNSSGSKLVSDLRVPPEGR